MKRTGIKRGKKRLRSRTQLVRKPMARGSKLSTHKRMRAVGRRGRKIRATLARLRPLVFDRDEHLCQRCRRLRCLPLEAHHRRSRGAGGEHALENLVTLGEPCHRLVTARACENWREFVDTRKGAR